MNASIKVLWISNTIFPDLAEELGEANPVIGGWMYGMAKDLAKYGVELTVATTSTSHDATRKKVGDINYYLLKGTRHSYYYDRGLEKQWIDIINTVQPDIVHIHGTEAAPGLALMNACPELDYVVSIQGMISVIERYYFAGIPPKEISRNITFRDIVRNDSIFKARKKFKKRGANTEIKYIEKTSHIIGRTLWDKAHTLAINPEVRYHFCNESLRDEFYDSRKWNNKNKIDHTIMLSAGNYPIKGLHMVLKALPIVKQSFPKVRVRVVGNDITASGTFSEKLRLSGYGSYIKKLIKVNGLTGNIEFLGRLDAVGMIQEYLKSHIFICPSSIENSPNSLGEAQLLGTPVIAAYAGGIPDMVRHEESGLLYRFEEVEMLARHIIRIFNDGDFALKISEGGTEAASVRHNRATNLNDLMSCYTTILAKKGF